MTALLKGSEIGWVEYQCHTDAINFYKSDPAHLMQLDSVPANGSKRPITRQIRIRDMVSKEAYARIRRNFFRVHYQFVFGNTRKYHYDFLAICFGPARLQNRALDPNLVPQSLDDLDVPPSVHPNSSGNDDVDERGEG